MKLNLALKKLAKYKLFNYNFSFFGNNVSYRYIDTSMFEIVIVHPYFTFLSIFFSNMPLIFASQQENLNFNLIELRKLRIADSIDSGFYNNVAISNKYQVAFVAFKNGMYFFVFCFIK